MALARHKPDPPAPRLARLPGPAARGRGGRIGFTASGDGRTFLTAPLDSEMEITGPVAAKLSISSSTEDADLFLVLRAFAPDL